MAQNTLPDTHSALVDPSAVKSAQSGGRLASNHRAGAPLSGARRLIFWKGARSHRLYGLVRAASSSLDVRVAIRRPSRSHDRFVVVLNCFGKAPDWVAKEVRRALEEAPPDTPVLVGVDEEAAAVNAAYGAGATDTLGTVVAANPDAVRTHLATGLKLLQADASPPIVVPLDGMFGGSPSAASNADDEVADVPWAFTGRKRSRGPATAAERAVVMRLTGVGDDNQLTSAPTGLERLAPADRSFLLAAPDDRDLRAPGGAYDANGIAAALGVRRSQLGPALGVTPQALSKTPASPRAQPALAAIARVLRAARVVVGPSAVAAWLRTPMRRFGSATPLDVVLRGNATDLADQLDEVADGRPD